MAFPLLRLPSEVLLVIISYVEPEDLSHLSRMCKALNEATSEPFIWRQLCLSSYRYWKNSKAMQISFNCRPSNFDWRAAFIKRYIQDRNVRGLLNDAISSVVNRHTKLMQITEQGYEAKDVLIDEIKSEFSAEDGLARGYLARGVLRYIHRDIAIQELYTVMSHPWTKDSFERVLTALNVFVLDEREGDMNDISVHLDSLSIESRKSMPKFEELSVKEKAKLLVRFLRSRGFSTAEDDKYHRLENSFIGMSLIDESHSCLPIVAVGIFCSIARRLGFDARPLNFPFHVYAVVFTTTDTFSIDDRAIMHTVDLQDRFFMDPARSENEVDSDDLQAQLRALGANPNVHSPHLSVLDPLSALERIEKNLRRSLQIYLDTAAEENGHIQVPPIWTGDFPRTLDVFYFCNWAAMIRDYYRPGSGSIMHTFNLLCRKVLRDFEDDLWLLKKFVVPHSQGFIDAERLVQTGLKYWRSDDGEHFEVKPRSPENSAVRYKVGQIFKHKRYQYWAVVTGWDRQCAQTKEWMAQMNVDDLPRGPDQCFYDALAWDGSNRYVAEENIEVQTEDPPPQLLHIVGKYFKRWDSSTRTFVSNIRERYPDD